MEGDTHFEVTSAAEVPSECGRRVVRVHAASSHEQFPVSFEAVSATNGDGTTGDIVAFF